MSVLGGRTHWLGPVIGAAFVVLLQDRLTAPGWSGGGMIILGAILAVFVVAAPEAVRRLRARPVAGVGCLRRLSPSGRAVIGGLEELLYGMRRRRWSAPPSWRCGPAASGRLPGRLRRWCRRNRRSWPSRSDRPSRWCRSNRGGDPSRRRRQRSSSASMCRGTSAACGRSTACRCRSPPARSSAWSARTARARRRW